jgi:hypothetical protein
MAEVFSGDLNLEIGDLLSRPISPAARPPCARPLMLTRAIHAHTSILRTHPFTPGRPLHMRTCCCLNLKTGDLLSGALSPATRPPSARPLILKRAMHAHTSIFTRAPVHAWALATRAHPLLPARDPASACAPVPRAPVDACAPASKPSFARPFLLRASSLRASVDAYARSL